MRRPPEWVVFSGPSLVSQSVPPIIIRLDDSMINLLHTVDHEAWVVLIYCIENCIEAQNE